MQTDWKNTEAPQRNDGEQLHFGYWERLASRCDQPSEMLLLLGRSWAYYLRCFPFYKGLSGNGGGLHKAGQGSGPYRLKSPPVESPPWLPAVSTSQQSQPWPSQLTVWGMWGEQGAAPSLLPAFLAFRVGWGEGQRTAWYPGWILPVALLVCLDHLAVVRFALETRISSNLAVIIAPNGF